jgi:hypothetical protein
MELITQGDAWNHLNYKGRYTEHIRIIQIDAWNSSELYRSIPGTHPNYTRRCTDLIRIIQGDAWNLFQLYRMMNEKSVFTGC